MSAKSVSGRLVAGNKVVVVCDSDSETVSWKGAKEKGAKRCQGRTRVSSKCVG